MWGGSGAQAKIYDDAARKALRDKATHYGIDHNLDKPSWNAFRNAEPEIQEKLIGNQAFSEKLKSLDQTGASAFMMRTLAASKETSQGGSIQGESDNSFDQRTSNQSSNPFDSQTPANSIANNNRQAPVLSTQRSAMDVLTSNMKAGTAPNQGIAMMPTSNPSMQAVPMLPGGNLPNMQAAPMGTAAMQYVPPDRVLAPPPVFPPAAAFPQYPGYDSGYYPPVVPPGYLPHGGPGPRINRPKAPVTESALEDHLNCMRNGCMALDVKKVHKAMDLIISWLQKKNPQMFKNMKNPLEGRIDTAYKPPPGGVAAEAVKSSASGPAVGISARHPFVPAARSTSAAPVTTAGTPTKPGASKSEKLVEQVNTELDGTLGGNIDGLDALSGVEMNDLQGIFDLNEDLLDESKYTTENEKLLLEGGEQIEEGLNFDDMLGTNPFAEDLDAESSCTSDEEGNNKGSKSPENSENAKASKGNRTEQRKAKKERKRARKAAEKEKQFGPPKPELKYNEKDKQIGANVRLIFEDFVKRRDFRPKGVNREDWKRFNNFRAKCTRDLRGCDRILSEFHKTLQSSEGEGLTIEIFEEILEHFITTHGMTKETFLHGAPWGAPIGMPSSQMMKGPQGFSSQGGKGGMGMPPYSNGMPPYGGDMGMPQMPGGHMPSFSNQMPDGLLGMNHGMMDYGKAGKDDRKGGRNDRDGRGGKAAGGRDNRDGGKGGRNDKDGGKGGRNDKDGGKGGRNDKDGGNHGRDNKKDNNGGANKRNRSRGPNSGGGNESKRRKKTLSEDDIITNLENFFNAVVTEKAITGEKSISIEKLQKDLDWVPSEKGGGVKYFINCFSRLFFFDHKTKGGDMQVGIKGPLDRVKLDLEINVIKLLSKRCPPGGNLWEFICKEIKSDMVQAILPASERGRIQGGAGGGGGGSLQKAGGPSGGSTAPWKDDVDPFGGFGKGDMIEKESVADNDLTALLDAPADEVKEDDEKIVF